MSRKQLHARHVMPPPWNRLGAELETTKADRPPRAGAADSEASSPERVGPYRIVRHLASGGMGDVFLAEQSEPVHRRLAVKLIRTTLARGHGEARFRAEQQAMARLAHPNVAKLFDAGTSARERGTGRRELAATLAGAGLGRVPKKASRPKPRGPEEQTQSGVSWPRLAPSG